MDLGFGQTRDSAEGRPLDLEATFRRHRGDIERWASRLGGPLVDAEDVAQEVMMVAYARLPKFQHDAQRTTWLFKTTQNIAARHRRRERMRRWLGGMPLDYAADLQARGPSVLEEMERREAAADVYSALDKVAEKYRSVVILFEIEGLSGEEIASLTGTSMATVWVHLHRGRRKLRDHYQALQAKKGVR
jgi:RNA polymerase sigma-70 factor, ECF subfamily